MIGYGAEDNHFVAELTYNYGVKSYKLGNVFHVWIMKYIMQFILCFWIFNIVSRYIYLIT